MSKDNTNAESTKNVLKHLLKEKNKEAPAVCAYCEEDNSLNLYFCKCGHVFCTLHVSETFINNVMVDTCPNCNTILDNLY